MDTPQYPRYRAGSLRSLLRKEGTSSPFSPVWGTEWGAGPWGSCGLALPGQHCATRSLGGKKNSPSEKSWGLTWQCRAWLGVGGALGRPSPCEPHELG